MASTIKIVSDGTPVGTHVYAGAVELTNIKRIEFMPILPGGLVEVRLTFLDVAFDMAATCKDDIHA